jgi:hypothetical protein
VLSRSDSIKLFASSGSSCKVKWSRIHRASENEFSAAAFHRLCDDKGPTITLVKAWNGRIAGGYSCVSWNSVGFNGNNPRGFLFSIDERKLSVNLFKGVPGKCKTLHKPVYGPWFQFGLGIFDKCDKNTSSYSNMGEVFEHGGDALALFGSQEFTVAEYEVFGIELS